MVLDIVVCCLCGLAAIIGYKKGLVTVILKLVGLILAVVLAYYFCDTVAIYVKDNTKIATTIEQTVEQGITQYIEEVTGANESKEENSEKENTTKDVIDDDENVEIFNKIFELANISISKEIEENDANNISIAKKIADKVTWTILKVLGFIAIFIGVSIVTAIISFVLNAICKLPIIKGINKSGGLVLNVLLLLAKIWIVMGIMSFVAGVDIIKPAIAYIESSYVCKWMYENNILAQVLFRQIM